MTSWGKLGVASGASDWYISVAGAARGALLRARCARLAAPLSGLEATSRLALWLERGLHEEVQQSCPRTLRSVEISQNCELTPEIEV